MNIALACDIIMSRYTSLVDVLHCPVLYTDCRWVATQQHVDTRCLIH